MAAPVVASSAVTGIATAADPWVVNYPASIAAGDLLMAFGRSASVAGMAVPAGWNGVGTINSNDASDDWNSVIWKIADGTETGTFNWDVHTATTKGGVVVLRITGHGCGPGSSNPPVMGYNAVAYTTANQNPAALSPGVSNDWLFIVGLGQDGESTSYTSPSGYSAVLIGNSGTGGAVATNCQIVIATKGTTAVTSDDPGAWVNPAPATGGMQYGGWVPPAGPLAAGSIHQTRRRRSGDRFLTRR